MNEWIIWLKQLSWQNALLLFWLENLAVILLALGFGHLVIFYFQLQGKLGSRTVSISRKELGLATLTCFMNTLITFAGYWLWKEDYIRMQEGFSVRIIADVLVIFLGMDFLMYVFHFTIHKTFLYRLIHQLHHHYADPKPIDLFVLHPIETIGFGSLWLLIIGFYPASYWAVFSYLALNVFFGVLGHTGVEPVPLSWQRHKLLKYIGTSTFHFSHHQQEGYNFGFYTTIWDELFGTRLPDKEGVRL